MLKPCRRSVPLSRHQRTRLLWEIWTLWLPATRLHLEQACGLGRAAHPASIYKQCQADASTTDQGMQPRDWSSVEAQTAHMQLHLQPSMAGGFASARHPQLRIGQPITVHAGGLTLRRRGPACDASAWLAGSGSVELSGLFCRD